MFKLPIHLILLDGIGTIMLGLGLAEWFASTNFIPVGFQFENYAQVMVLLGGLAMLLATIFLMRHFLKGKSRGSE